MLRLLVPAPALPQRTIRLLNIFRLFSVPVNRPRTAWQYCARLCFLWSGGARRVVLLVVRWSPVVELKAVHTGANPHRGAPRATGQGIVPPGNRPREDRFLPGEATDPRRRIQAPRQGDVYVRPGRMTKGNDIREIIDKAREEMIFIGPDHPYYPCWPAWSPPSAVRGNRATTITALADRTPTPTAKVLPPHDQEDPDHGVRRGRPRAKTPVTHMRAADANG
jgi:hypothetical protein